MPRTFFRYIFSLFIKVQAYFELCVTEFRQYLAFCKKMRTLKWDAHCEAISSLRKIPSCQKVLSRHIISPSRRLFVNRSIVYLVYNYVTRVRRCGMKLLPKKSIPKRSLVFRSDAFI